jgi:hypothetical protein
VVPNVRHSTGSWTTRWPGGVFLSGRTVEWRLRKVVAQLGISSRKWLGAVLS